jgi:hypothetical protein
MKRTCIHFFIFFDILCLYYFNMDMQVKVVEASMGGIYGCHLQLWEAVGHSQLKFLQLLWLFVGPTLDK